MNRPRGLILIGGYKQRAGLASLYTSLCTDYPLRPEVRIFSRPYNVDVLGLADEICAAHEPTDDLRAAFFSWGNPTGLALSQELCRRGYTLRHIVMLDPVPRTLGFLPIGRLTVPENVECVHLLRQANDGGLMRFVRGRLPRLQDPSFTRIVEDIVIKRTTHVWLDDSPIFNNKVREVFRVSYKAA